MAEPLKNIYDLPFIERLGGLMQEASPSFDSGSFAKRVTDKTWDGLELKARTRRIARALGECLPDDYEEALRAIFAVEGQFEGLAHLVFPDFVEVYGQEERHWQLSVDALRRLTVRSSAEFAVRPFLLRDPQRMMRQMLEWAADPDEHVRRLASEGCRPRLPWGQALPMFKRDPAPVLPILERLKADPSLYVRKSVANNLNDIAKDHPALVLDIARRWRSGHRHPHTDWIVRHGCRTLIRAANPEALALFGYAQEDGPLVEAARIDADPAAGPIGGSAELRYGLRVRSGAPIRIRVEYAVDFVKANGRASRKKFLLADRTMAGGETLDGARTHRWADLSTRKHYPGDHRIALLVNGTEAAAALFRLLPPSGEAAP